MATSILVYAFPLDAATQRDLSAMIPYGCLGQRCCSKAALFRTPLSSSNSVRSRRELGFGSNRALRRRVLLKAHEKDEGGVDDAKSFYATSDFWIQIAVVVLTFGFVDAGVLLLQQQLCKSTTAQAQAAQVRGARQEWKQDGWVATSVSIHGCVQTGAHRSHEGGFMEFTAKVYHVRSELQRYSGDWSRIGALSRETEAQLRTAAYLVVPFSAALVWAIGKRKETM